MFTAERPLIEGNRAVPRAGTGKSPLGVLAAWAAVHHDFSSVASDRAKDAFVDIAACMIAGMNEPSTLSVAAAAASFGTGASFAFVGGRRLASPFAALVNGTAAHAMDFDDNFAPALTHATAVLAPALLALSDENRAGGDELIAAYIVGLELQGRIGRLLQPAHYQRGWHSTATIGAIGTAGACVRLLGGDAEQILVAMSAATSMAGGSKLQFGSMMKPVHAGLAAKNAVLAARLAMAGIGANADPLAGDWGFAALTGAGHPDPDIMIESLGAALEIETSGLVAKRFPCCGAVHRSLDALESLRNRPEFSLDAVDHVETSMPEMARRNLRFDNPVDGMEARFSATYCIARLLVDGALTLEHFLTPAVGEERIAAWLPRIHLITYDNAFMIDGADFDATTRVYLKDGQILEATVSRPKGSPENPLSGGDLFAKFQTCCAWSGRPAASLPLFKLAGSLGSTTPVTQTLVAIERILGAG
ncbi:MAG: MmgE/PrpD family protein [Allorhizobium sp.]